MLIPRLGVSDRKAVQESFMYIPVSTALPAAAADTAMEELTSLLATWPFPGWSDGAGVKEVTMALAPNTGTGRYDSARGRICMFGAAWASPAMVKRSAFACMFDA